MIQFFHPLIFEYLQYVINTTWLHASHLGNEDKCFLPTDASDRDTLSSGDLVNLVEDIFSSVTIYSSNISMRLPLKVKNTGDFGVKVAFRNWVVATHKEIRADIITMPIKI